MIFNFSNRYEITSGCMNLINKIICVFKVPSLIIKEDEVNEKNFLNLKYKKPDLNKFKDPLRLKKMLSNVNASQAIEKFCETQSRLKTFLNSLITLNEKKENTLYIYEINHENNIYNVFIT
jgi:hypothetical protein